MLQRSPDYATKLEYAGLGAGLAPEHRGGFAVEEFIHMDWEDLRHILLFAHFSNEQRQGAPRRADRRWLLAFVLKMLDVGFGRVLERDLLWRHVDSPLRG